MPSTRDSRQPYRLSNLLYAHQQTECFKSFTRDSRLYTIHHRLTTTILLWLSHSHSYTPISTTTNTRATVLLLNYLCDGVVHIDCWNLEFTFLKHLVQVVHTGRRLLRNALYSYAPITSVIAWSSHVTN